MPVRYQFCLTNKKYSSVVDFTTGVWYSMCGFIQRMTLGPLTRLFSGRPKDSPLQLLSDEELMDAVQHGNGDAFAIVFDRFHRLVLITALRIVGDASEAEEVTQNVFFEIYRCADKFDAAKGTLKVWLLQYAYHRSINRRNYLLLRQFYSQACLDDALDWEEGAQIQPRLFGQEVTRAVKEALATLNDAQRRTIEMVFFEGWTLKDVAGKTKQSHSNVRNHYYRGLERLRNCLTAEPTIARHEKRVSLEEASHAKA